MPLYVQETGTQGAPSIVFLHGAGTSGWMWDTQIHDFSDFHCLNVDLPGHGKSNHIPWISTAQTATEVAALIQERAAHQRADVVGLSLGGYVAIQLLAQHSACVNRVVLSGVTAAPLPNKRMTALQMRVMSLFMKQRWFIRSQARMLRIPAEALDAYTEGMLATSRQAFIEIFKELLDFQLPPNLSQIHVPVLVTAGSLEVPLILDGIQTIARTMPNVVGYVAPGLHHGWNGEDPALFSAMLRAWFTDTPFPDQLEPLQEMVAH